MSEFVMTVQEANMVYPQLDADAKTATRYDTDRLITQDQYDQQVQAAMANFPQMQLDGLKTYAASVRYRKESAGLSVDVGGGVTVAIETTVASQSKISSAAQLAQVNPNFTTNWKQADGTFVLLSADQIVKMNESVTAYVSSCYATEKDCIDQIDAGTITSNDQIDAIFGF